MIRVRNFRKWQGARIKKAENAAASDPIFWIHDRSPGDHAPTCHNFLHARAQKKS